MKIIRNKTVDLRTKVIWVRQSTVLNEFGPRVRPSTMIPNDPKRKKRRAKLRFRQKKRI